MAHEEDKPEIEQSDLDEMTHRELGLVYDDSTRTLLFAKSIQWKVIGSSLLIFLAVIGLLRFLPYSDNYLLILKIAVLFTAMAGFVLVLIFQFWQHTEAQKISAIEKLFSSAFRDVRKKKSGMEANVHRYIILILMVGAIVMGTYITIVSINNFTRLPTNQFEYNP